MRIEELSKICNTLYIACPYPNNECEYIGKFVWRLFCSVIAIFRILPFIKFDHHLRRYFMFGFANLGI